MDPPLTGQTPDKYSCQSGAEATHLLLPLAGSRFTTVIPWRHLHIGAVKLGICRRPVGSRQSCWVPEGGLFPSPGLGTPFTAPNTKTTSMEVPSVRFSLKLLNLPSASILYLSQQIFDQPRPTAQQRYETSEPWTYRKLM